MDQKTYIEFAGVIIVVLCFVWQHKLFVRPEDLLTTKAEILKEIQEKYMSKELADTINKNIEDIRDQLKILSAYILGTNDKK